VSFEFIKNVDHTLYPRKALLDARQAYLDYCTLKVVPLGNDRVQLSITVKDSHENESKQVVLEFLNYLLDRSAQLVLEEEAE
jgi:hypothetical protein